MGAKLRREMTRKAKGFDLSDAMGTQRHRYLDIVQAIADSIRSTKLEPGARLPPQRTVASELGMSIATVNKAYGEAARRGLIVTHVGRGTFVAGSRPESSDLGPANAVRTVDLTTNRLSFDARTSAEFERAVRSIASSGELVTRLSYQPGHGHLRHREAGCSWLSKVGVTAAPDEVIICNGLQHGISLVLTAFSRQGDVLLTEELNYPGVRLLAKAHDIRVQGVPVDDEGLSADALASACENSRARFLLCTPFVHNPTNAVMSLRRRKRIAEIADRYDLTLIECDNNEIPSLEPLPPLCQLVPTRSLYVSSVWRVTGFGICMGFIRAPVTLVPRLSQVLQATSWMLSPFQAEVFSALIDQGTTDRILGWHREEYGRRLELARSILHGGELRYHAASPNVWLPLPEPWRREDFVRVAEHSGVLVTTADVFMVDRSVAPHAVRISLGGVGSLTLLERGLRTLQTVLSQQPQPAQMMV